MRLFFLLLLLDIPSIWPLRLSKMETMASCHLPPVHHRLMPLFASTTTISTNVTIIGSGVGGLVCAGILAANNMSVAIIEKNTACGGRMQSESHSIGGGTYRWDIGPSLILLPNIYQKTFDILGSPLESHLELLKVDPLYRCFFPDGTMMDISDDEEKMKRNLEAVESGSFEAFKEYMSDANNFLEFGLPNVIEEKFSPAFLLKFLQSCIRNFPLLSHESMLRKYFRTPKVRAMMSFQDLYIGLSPYEAPAIFSLLQAIELAKGIYYPRGGFTVVAKSLEDIAINNGVNIIKDFEAISVNAPNGEGNGICEVAGNCVEGMINTIKSRKVICNMDVPGFESSNLIPPSLADKRAASMRSSTAVLSLSFAFDVTLTPLAHHSLFLSEYFEESWAVVERSGSTKNDDDFDPSACNFYVHAPSRTDDSVCPKGHDAITVLIPIPLLADGVVDLVGREDALVSVLQLEVLHRIQQIEGMPADITSHVIHKHFRSARQWENDFGLFRGSAFGLAHTIKQLSFLRPRIQHPKMKNLYRVGASSRPGNGVPLVMIGARLTAEKILRDFGL